MTASQQRRPWLIQARERAGHSQDSLGNALGVTGKTVSHWERGRSVPRPKHRPILAETLGFTVNELCRRLDINSAPEQDALNGNGQGAFEAITEWPSMFVRAEQSAYAIRTLVAYTLPALCQTDGYARAVEHSGHRDFTPQEVDELVERRLARAAVLDRGAELVALIPVPLLDAQKGGPDVMATQLAHLLALTDRPNVTLRVIDIEHLSAAPGPFALLSTAGPGPDVATEIGVKGLRLDEGPTAVADYVRLFDHLMCLARGPEASRAAIARSADRFAAKVTNKRGTR